MRGDGYYVFKAEELTLNNFLIDPRRACAAKVTVLGRCVCVCVCVCVRVHVHVRVHVRVCE